ncbi:hypothetical protein M9H77_29858 [Catharanthus roseus]|uniref:Uncharacterized protein n=1 Tax=Catharanthus roseus TaxID=4058 RepID=A0ACB9ZWI7_CATRO|nr:hypothetical protein M9H77_29858 [Catharanthus roseus]
MKKTGLVAASMAAASATAFSGASTSIKTKIPHENDVSCKKKKDEKSAVSKKSSNGSDKFAPRFDGLRFIETLVTAHR